MTYTSIVSHESVQIALTIAALNDLEVKASDVKNAFLTAPCTEKVWTTLGPEFGDDCGKKGNYHTCTLWFEVSRTVLHSTHC